MLRSKAKNFKLLTFLFVQWGPAIRSTDTAVYSLIRTFEVSTDSKSCRGVPVTVLVRIPGPQCISICKTICVLWTRILAHTIHYIFIFPGALLSGMYVMLVRLHEVKMLQDPTLYNSPYILPLDMALLSWLGWLLWMWQAHSSELSGSHLRHNRSVKNIYVHYTFYHIH